MYVKYLQHTHMYVCMYVIFIFTGTRTIHCMMKIYSIITLSFFYRMKLRYFLRLPSLARPLTSCPLRVWGTSLARLFDRLLILSFLFGGCESMVIFIVWPLVFL